MYTPDEVMIEDSLLDLIAEKGERVALVVAINLDVNTIVSASAFYEYEGTFAVQSGHPVKRAERLDTYSHLLNYFGDTPDVVRQQVEGVIETQEHSDDETRFTWELITGTETVREDDKLAETLATVIGPERLDPDFNIPEDAMVAVLDVGFEAHDIIREANEYRVGVPVDIHRHRGQTYLVGLTEEYARAISNGIHELQMEYKDGGHYESAETAERVEGKVLNAETETMGASA
jgi:hypothetical protein